ncbi:cilia- and flagella-associated protein 184 isoform X3 [Petromyzon marinus]|uniref:Coiled-coil domain-containing protein 96 isoform X3 n=2 Tax=Petromyzon marinus TaxID=7757 RepID=A0AAJ7XH58_PETMA|nr:coiled-coil domain-containing protein 96 isoform X3 [Petromyzon marinus]
MADAGPPAVTMESDQDASEGQSGEGAVMEPRQDRGETDSTEHEADPVPSDTADSTIGETRGMEDTDGAIETPAEGDTDGAETATAKDIEGPEAAAAGDTDRDAAETPAETDTGGAEAAADTTAVADGDSKGEEVALLNSGREEMLAVGETAPTEASASDEVDEGEARNPDGAGPEVIVMEGERLSPGPEQEPAPGAEGDGSPVELLTEQPDGQDSTERAEGDLAAAEAAEVAQGDRTPATPTIIAPDEESERSMEEPVSREPSAHDGRDCVKAGGDGAMVGNLDAVEEQDMENTVEGEMEPQMSHEELLEKYQALHETHEKLLRRNGQLQHKLADYFRRKKGEDGRVEVERGGLDQEQKYLKYMVAIEDVRRQEQQQRLALERQVADLSARQQQQQECVEAEWRALAACKRQAVLAAIRTRIGRHVSKEELKQMEQSEERKEEEVAHVRLQNIKLKNRLRKQEQMLRSREELGEGLHLIDFEQLKIENQTYNEKVEERNEELLKLRRKITCTVHMLTHVKEKLQFVQVENEEQRAALASVEVHVAQRRDALTRTKQARDALRTDNIRLRRRAGLLGSPQLLRDLEVAVDGAERLRGRLQELRARHAELALAARGVRAKVEQARAVAATGASARRGGGGGGALVSTYGAGALA